MKRLTFVFFALTLCLAVASCGKEYDDTELKGKVDKITEKVNTIKANQQAMQAVIDIWKTGGYVQSIDNSVPGQHTITFYGENGKRYVIYGKETMNTKNGQLLVREGELTTPWETILGVDTVDADYTTAFYTDSFIGGMASSNSAVDVAIWQTANEIFIALDKQKAGLAVYRMYAE